MYDPLQGGARTLVPPGSDTYVIVATQVAISTIMSAFVYALCSSDEHFELPNTMKLLTC